MSFHHPFHFSSSSVQQSFPFTSIQRLFPTSLYRPHHSTFPMLPTPLALLLTPHPPHNSSPFPLRLSFFSTHSFSLSLPFFPSLIQWNFSDLSFSLRFHPFPPFMFPSPFHYLPLSPLSSSTSYSTLSYTSPSSLPSSRFQQSLLIYIPLPFIPSIHFPIPFPSLPSSQHQSDDSSASLFS